MSDLPRRGPGKPDRAAIGELARRELARPGSRRHSHRTGRRRVRFTRAELESFHGAKVDDLIGPGLRLLFVGINPGLWTAAVNAHFARPGNRFWPALQLAGITPYRIDASARHAPPRP